MILAGMLHQVVDTPVRGRPTLAACFQTGVYSISLKRALGVPSPRISRSGNDHPPVLWENRSSWGDGPAGAPAPALLPGNVINRAIGHSPEHFPR